MHLITLALALLAPLAFADRTADIFAWPLSASSSQSLASCTYNSTHATVKNYKPPTIPTGDEVVRIGFHHPDKQWSGVATAASNFGPGKDRTLLLHVDAKGELYHVGFKATLREGGSSSASGSGKDGLDVEVVRAKEGQGPVLNKPVVLTAEGKVEGKEPEKSFFQKYWWVIGGFILFQVVMSGGGKE
ncbi:uncharacterized protein LTR77_005743 [Saxophila tyrrhenica]|uniref:Uncharacterized protein n=1 Tax=Saxophila tyrrhenica TaxID=1690608 RepID=A0AAV9PDL2_9PEZI|nr:hypothetical protein LTR77_005743 [Saxophila tyrrhenica]